jgi:hypothetical protein
MSALEVSLDGSGQSDHAQMMRAAELLKQVATILDNAGLLAIRARLQEVLDAIEDTASHPGSSAPRKDS